MSNGFASIRLAREKNLRLSATDTTRQSHQTYIGVGIFPDTPSKKRAKRKPTEHSGVPSTWGQRFVLTMMDFIRCLVEKEKVPCRKCVCVQRHKATEMLFCGSVTMFHHHCAPQTTQDKTLGRGERLSRTCPIEKRPGKSKHLSCSITMFCRVQRHTKIFPKIMHKYTFCQGFLMPMC